MSLQALSSPAMAKDLQDICRNRLTPDRRISQCLVTPASLVKRVNFISTQENLPENRVLCVGDDDFTSLALCKISKPKEVTVIDIDGRILDKIQSISEANELPIKTVYFDLREVYDRSFPQHFCNSFDIAIADPPTTSDGIRLFLAFAMHSLKEGGRIYLAVPFDHKIQETRKLLFLAENILLSNGFIISHIEPYFHEYEEYANNVFVPSSMIRAIMLRKKPLDIGSFEGKEFLYQPLCISK